MDCSARKRNYNLERRHLNKLKLNDAFEHPLKLPTTSQTSVQISSSRSENSIKSSISLNTLLKTNVSEEFSDPLSMFAAEAGNSISENVKSPLTTSNVLTNELAKNASIHDETDNEKNNCDGFETWNEKKASILTTFTTSKMVSLITNVNKKDATNSTTATSITEKVKTRLEQLDEFEEGSVQETLSLSQDEYINHINQLGKSLVAAWKVDQRVKTLKIAIQCSKLLTDTSSKQFYPSMFVVITEILDNFGRLVMERLLDKATSTPLTTTSTATSYSVKSQHPMINLGNINPSLVSDVAKETCKNWIFKISSIREILPRVYVEASVLKCFDFLSLGGAVSALDRLLMSSRGVADPIVSTYLRCYLVKMADTLCQSSKQSTAAGHQYGGKKDSIISLVSSSSSSSAALSHPQNLVDQIDSTKPSSSSSSSSVMSSFFMRALTDSLKVLTSYFESLTGMEKKTREEKVDYLSLLAPSFDWMMRCLSRWSYAQLHNYDALDDVHKIIDTCEDFEVKGLLIGSFIDQSPADYVARQASVISKLIRQLQDKGPVCLKMPELYRRLGVRLTKDNPADGSLAEESRRPLLNEAWTSMSRCYLPEEYMRCAMVWSVFVARYFGKKEVNVVMADVVKKMMVDRSFEGQQMTLRLTLQHLIGCQNSTLFDIISCSNFPNYLDMFNAETKAQVCRDVLIRFSSMIKESRSSTLKSKSGRVILSDPVVVHTMMTVCKYLHDNVTAVTADDEVRDIGTLISNFIGTVSTESSETQLGFYVKYRSTFYNIDPVLMYLVHKVNQLIVEGKARKRDGPFYRACCAYTFITIPSLNSVLYKLNLYNISGQLALHCTCVSQADDFFRAGILLISQMPRYLEVDGKVMSTDSFLLEFVQNLSSTLIFVPDPPHLPPLSLFNLLFSQLQSHKWDLNVDCKFMAYSSLLVSLSTLLQDSLPYKMANVDANDDLYGGDPKFLAEVDKLARLITSNISEHLQQLDKTRAKMVAAKIFHVLLPHFDPSSSLSSTSFLHYLLNLMVAGSTPKSNTSKQSRNVSELTSPAFDNTIHQIKLLAKKDPKYNGLLQYFSV